MTRQKIIEYCLTMPGAYEDYPFDEVVDDNACTVMRHRQNKKSFGFLAGIDDEKLFTHNLRHFFATVFMDVNKDLPGLADVLGHKNMNTTRIYLKKNKKAQMKQLSNLGL